MEALRFFLIVGGMLVIWIFTAAIIIAFANDIENVKLGRKSTLIKLVDKKEKGKRK